MLLNPKRNKMTSVVVYKGELRTQATHLRSGNQLITDAPVDNNGKGEAFSPTDLVATALASCIFTIIGIAASKRKINLNGAVAQVTKIMSSAPRKISKIIVDIQMPKNIKYTKAQEKILRKAAEACPVGRSLHPDLEQEINLIF